MKFILICGILGLCLSGCMAIGVPHSADPHQMLVYAYDMMNQGRPIPAKNLIDSSINKYHEMNDNNGLAEAYHTMGNLYKSGDFDASVYGNKFTDYNISLSYFTKSEELYKSVNNYEGMIKSRFGIANIYTIKGDLPSACKEYDKSNNYYQEMLQKKPEQENKLNILTGFNNFPDILKAFKNKYNCQ